MVAGRGAALFWVYAAQAPIRASTAAQRRTSRDLLMVETISHTKNEIVLAHPSRSGAADCDSVTVYPEAVLFSNRFVAPGVFHLLGSILINALASAEPTFHQRGVPPLSRRFLLISNRAVSAVQQPLALAIFN